MNGFSNKSTLEIFRAIALAWYFVSFQLKFQTSRLNLKLMLSREMGLSTISACNDLDATTFTRMRSAERFCSRIGKKLFDKSWANTQRLKMIKRLSRKRY